MTEWMERAIAEALLDLAADGRGNISRRALELWWREDNGGMKSHVRGSVSAQARMDKVDPRPTNDEIDDALASVLERDHGLISSRKR